MRHRFPVGTQYWTRGKNPRLCTVVDHMTVTDRRGRVASIHYITQHVFLGQKIDEHNVVDATIARGLLSEFKHLLAAEEPAVPPDEPAIHAPARLQFHEDVDANSYALVDQSGHRWMSVLVDSEQVTERHRAILTRMAAAWNACDGISTPKLEDNVPFRELIRRCDAAAELTQVAPHGIPESCGIGADRRHDGDRARQHEK